MAMTIARNAAASRCAIAATRRSVAVSGSGASQTSRHPSGVPRTGNESDGSFPCDRAIVAPVSLVDCGQSLLTAIHRYPEYRTGMGDSPAPCPALILAPTGNKPTRANDRTKNGRGMSPCCRSGSNPLPGNRLPFPLDQRSPFPSQAFALRPERRRRNGRIIPPVNPVESRTTHWNRTPLLHITIDNVIGAVSFGVTAVTDDGWRIPLFDACLGDAT